VKVPKDTIDAILGTPNWISNDNDTLEYIIERELEKLYNNYATASGLEDMDELEFTISMDFKNENTVTVTIEIESDVTLDFSNTLYR
jgi:NADPH-dependent 7-cyano-7-deazaguanine reductase QueF-like protein